LIGNGPEKRKGVIFMRFMSFGISFVVSLLLAGSAIAADTYQFDVAHSSLAFSVKHMVISNVRGTFKDFTGTILYDEKDVTKSKVNVVIKVTSIDTDNEKRDSHLRSSDFFAAEKYPEITFTSTEIEKKGKDKFILKGDFTMRGVTKEITIPFGPILEITDPWGNKRIGAQGELKINRMDYGVSWDNALETGQLIVSDEVKIELSVEAIKQ
jgi:polyisoprenoid-binding protein YceI